MRTTLPIAALLLSCAVSASAQTPKLPTVRVPGNVPGAGQLRSLPKSPQQAAREARQDEVQELMRQALETEDPEEQARIYTQILLIDPNNQVAYNGRKDALARLEQQRTEQQQQQVEQETAIQSSLNQEMQRRQALQKAEEAFTADDLETAQHQIAIAKEAAPNDPEVQRMDQLIQERAASKRRLKWILIGAGVLLTAGLLVFLIVWMRNRDPYLEVVSGQHKGTKIPIDKDLVRLGAVKEDGGDQNDVALPDIERMISRFHCEIHRRGSKLFVIDVGSANGTFLDRRQISPGKPVRLKRGSRVDLAGTCALRVGFERRK